MKKIYFLLTFLISLAHSIDDVSLPTDFNTVGSGTRANLAANFTELATKFNNAMDSVEQVRALFSNYTGKLTVKSLQSILAHLDTDNNETAYFMAVDSDGDTLFYIKEDSTAKFFGPIINSTLTASRLIASNSSQEVVSVASLGSWVAGTTNQITVTDDGDGTITLSTPQDLHTSANAQFGTINTGLGATEVHFMNQDVQTTDNVQFDSIFTTSGAYFSENIGVGRSNPIAGIHIEETTLLSDHLAYLYSNSTQSGDGLRVFLDGAASTGTGIFVKNDGTGDIIRASDGSTENVVFVIKDGGDVGIGTSSPDAKLDVNGPVILDGNLSIGPSSNTPYIFGGALGLEFRNHANTSTNLTLSNSGQLGLRTNNPQAVVHIAAGLGTLPALSATNFLLQDNTSTSSTHYMTIIGGTTGAIGINFGDENDQDAGFVRYANGADFITIGTNGAETMRISSSGNIGIGTATPTAKLSVSGNNGVFASYTDDPSALLVSDFIADGGAGRNARLRLLSASLTDNNTPVIASDASTDVGLGFATTSGGVLSNTLYLKSNGPVQFTKQNNTLQTTGQFIRTTIDGGFAFDAQGGFVINLDTDDDNSLNHFNVRSNGDSTNLFSVVQSGGVGINKSSPTALLEIRQGGHGDVSGLVITKASDQTENILRVTDSTYTDDYLKVTSTGDVVMDNNLTVGTINTGQGANELYPMDQDVRTTAGPTFATINTGQGNNELYAMNQNVQTTNDVQFDDVRATRFTTNGTAFFDYEEGSFTGTGQGFVSDPSYSISYVKIGKIVTLTIPTFDGTSDSTGFQITGIPSNLRPSTSKTPTQSMFHGENNGTLSTMMRLTFNNTDRLDVYFWNGSSFVSIFTSSGIKSIHGDITLTYSL